MERTLVFDSAGSLVGFLSQGTFYAASREQDLRYPIGRVSDDGTVTSIEGWNRLGHLDGAEIRRGDSRLGEVVATIDGGAAISPGPSGVTLMQAEGAQVLPALAGAVILLEGHRPRDEHHFLRDAAALVGGVAAVAGATVPDARVESVAPPTRRLRPLPEGGLKELKWVLSLQARPFLGDQPESSLDPPPTRRGSRSLLAKLRVGMHVWVRTPLHEVGPGQIVEVSKDPLRGHGTPVTPAYLVAFWDRSVSWTYSTDLEVITKAQHDDAVANDPRRDLPALSGTRRTSPPRYAGMIFPDSSGDPEAALADAESWGYRGVTIGAERGAIVTAAEMPAEAPLWVVVHGRDTLDDLQHAAQEIAAAIWSGADIYGVTVVADSGLLIEAGLS